MAHRILSQSSHPMIKAYLPNLSAAVQHFRTFCSYDSRQSPNLPIINTDSKKEYSELVWPDKNLGPLASKDRRFPMPGCVGIRHKTTEHVTPPAPSSIRAVEPILDTNLPSRAVPQERHLSVLTEYLSNVNDLDEGNKYTTEPATNDTLEFLVQDCPQLLRHDFQDLFPERPLQGVLTVITISQKTENDMSGWSEEIEEEREDLLEHFIRGATEICESIQEAGYWADFIDPSSGRPYLGPYTNATLFETDERYRNFGFDIRDLGCCKVISHHLWGTHAYVGCLFTNAPSDHPVLTSLVVRTDN